MELTRRQQIQEYVKCSRDRWYFLTNYVYTLDPNAPEGVPKIRLFPKYGFLHDLVPIWERGEDMHIVKSRRMTATTFICAMLLWEVSFVQGFSAIDVSRKDKLVDDGGENSTWNSLHGKIRFMYDRLPCFLQHGMTFNSMRITNESQDSYIIGESGNVPDAGRGGSYTRGIMDEASKIPWSESVYASLKDACNTVVMNSTPAGKRGVFSRINYAKETRFNRIKMHWSIHPDRDNAWYKQECIDRTPEQIAEELDMSFERSVQGRCVPEFSYQRHVRSGLQYDPDLRLAAGWDFGIGDPTAVVWRQRSGDYHLHPACLQRRDLRVDQLSELAVAMMRQFGYQGRVGAVASHGDPSGVARSQQTGHSILNAYKQAGDWNILPATTMRHPTDWIAKLRKVIGAGHWFCSDTCVDLIDSMESLHYPIDRDGNVLATEIPDPKDHQWTHLPAANGYDIGSVLHDYGNLQPQLVAGV